MILREEQDLQFNREIDEHKEIIQKIYDDKLQEKSEEIEQELTESLTKELEQKIRKELIDDILNNSQNSISRTLTERVEAKHENLAQLAHLQALKLQNQKSSESDNNKTQDLEALMSTQKEDNEEFYDDHFEEQEESKSPAQEEQSRSQLFQSEKNKFKQDLMQTLPSVKSKEMVL